MKNRLLVLGLILSICLPVVSALRAQEAEHKKKQPEETELGKTMEKMNSAWRKLRRQAADPASNESSLELVATIKAGMEQALAYQPARVADVPVADREKFIADYQADIKAAGEAVAQLEAAFQAGDNAAAAELIKKIGAMQKEGHKEFKRPD